MSLTPQQLNQLRSLLEKGLPLVSRPYLELAQQLNTSEAAVLAAVEKFNQQGLFKRFGLVVLHRNLGFTSNCMLVLDIPDELVDTFGEQLAKAEGVNLCYQRPRRPNWPYNLFCMVHGTQRDKVIAHINQLLEELGLSQYPHHFLFSPRAFKQRGARYLGFKE